MISKKVYRNTVGGLELTLGVPLLGAVIVIYSLWTVLLLMLALHVVGLIISIKNKEMSTGHIVGIVASVIGWIPFVGMISHIITGIFLLVEANKK